MQNTKLIEFEKLYKQKLEEEEANTKRANELRGDIRASIRQTKERVQLIDPRVLDFYGIKIPEFSTESSIEDLKEFEKKLENSLDTLLSVSTEFLKTNNIELLSKLPNLSNNNSLADSLSTSSTIGVSVSDIDLLDYDQTAKENKTLEELL